LLYILFAFLMVFGAVIGVILFNRGPLLSPPGPLARLNTYLTSHVAATTDGAARPELRTPVFAVDAADLYQAVLGAAGTLGWRIADRQPEHLKLHAVVSTPLWHFKDDVQVQVLERGPGHSALRIHSQSRLGKADFAANTRHVLDLLDTVRARLGRQ
jgi:hypothetical protein